MSLMNESGELSMELERDTETMWFCFGRSATGEWSIELIQQQGPGREFRLSIENAEALLAFLQHHLGSRR